MKTILLMSCALCAGMNGYGNGMGIQEISLENNDVSKRKIQDGRIVTNSSSPKRIKKGDSPDCVTDEPHQEELDVVSDEKDSLEEIKETSRSGSEGDVLSRDSGNPSNQPPATKTHASDLVTEKLKEGASRSPDCVTAEPPQKGLDVVRSPTWWEDYGARGQLLQGTREVVKRLLDSQNITCESLKGAMTSLVQSYKTELSKIIDKRSEDGLVLENIMVYLDGEISCGISSRENVAAKALDVLDSSSFDELFSDNYEEK